MLTKFREVLSIFNVHDKEECIKFYREIQILEKILNSFLMPSIVPLTIVIIPLHKIIAQYVCVMLRDEIPMPGFLVFPIMGVDSTIVNILVFTLASLVHNASRDILQKLGQKIVTFRGGNEDRLRRKVKACAVLKIKFGSNFIDQGTPLVIQNFCMTQTMNLILMKVAR